MSAPRAIHVPPASKHTASIIVVHGLGDSGAGWSFLAENWRRREIFNEVAFIFPSAPNIPITVNMGMQMPGWYDITSFDSINRSEDEVGILRSRDYLHKLIQDELDKGVPSRRIILGGFSQGGAMSLFAGLTHPAAKRLGGIFGLSCYQLLEGKFDALRAEDAALASQPEEKELPKVFMGHGEADPLVQFPWGKATMEGLKKRGFEVEWHSYPGMEHTATMPEIDDLERWVAARLEETKDLAAAAGSSA